MKPGDKRATKAVMRNLTRETGIHEEAWQHFLVSETTQEQFETSAKAWLSDKSELKTDTIKCADWTEVYTYFQNQLKPDTISPCAGSLRFVEYDGQKLIMCLSHANETDATILDYRSNQYMCIKEWERNNI